MACLLREALRRGVLPGYEDALVAVSQHVVPPGELLRLHKRGAES